ncbi:putative leucine-rich repeat domain superfamily, F-box-like domain superfamily [Helianthus anomalus]
MDRISQLPDFILHHILSCIDSWDYPAELLRMSVLSRNWFHLTASFPILDFYIDQFSSRECFFKYVEYTTSRFCHQNVTADELRLVTDIWKPAELDIVNICLELALHKGVKLLEIDLTNSSESPFASAEYRLPNILLSVSVLESLSILAFFLNG